MDLDCNEDLCLILIKVGVLGLNVFEIDILVLFNYCMLIINDIIVLVFDECEILVVVKYFLGKKGVKCVNIGGVGYYYVLFEYYEVILGNGVWFESFQSGDYLLGMFEIV